MKAGKRFAAGILTVMVLISGIPYPGGRVEAEEVSLELEDTSSVPEETNENLENETEEIEIEEDEDIVYLLGEEIEENAVVDTEEDVIAQGTGDPEYGQITWVIDKNGMLTVTGMGNAKGEYGGGVPWEHYRDDILSAKIDVKNMTDAYELFAECKKLTEIDFSNFDTSQITNMSRMFYDCSSLIKLDVSNFNTSQVTDMFQMFAECTALEVLDVSGFDTGHVITMESMFYDCNSLTKLDVSNFDTSQVTNMDSMFYFCDGLEELDVSKFNTSQVKCMRFMFGGCENIKELDVSNFDTGCVTNMTAMFGGCKSLTKLDVSNFNTSKVTDMDSMFANCGKLVELNVSGFDMSRDINSMFYGCRSLTELNISNSKTSRVEYMIEVFRDCINLNKLDLSSFNTSHVTDMSGMFMNCSGLIKLDLSNFDTSQVNNMGRMFSGCYRLTELDLSNFDTKQVQSTESEYPYDVNKSGMYGMFENCSSLTKLDLSSFDTSLVESMGNMFSNCGNLTELNLSSFNTSNVTNMEYMFSSCDSLTQLNLSGFDMAKTGKTFGLLSGCSDLSCIQTPRNVVESVSLPTASGETWYKEDGTEVKELPQNMDHSITIIKKGGTPAFQPYITVQKIKTSYQCGDTLNIDDLTVTYYDSAENPIVVIAYSTNADKIDMSVPGEKKLIVTYNGLTETIILTVTDAVQTTYSVAFNLQGHGTNLPPYTDIKKGEKILKPDDPQAAGYIFTGWYKEAECKNKWNFNIDTVNDNITLYAGWVKIQEDLGDVLPQDVPSDGKIPGKTIWIPSIEDMVYTGKAIKPEVHIYWGKERLDEGVDYTLKYRNNTQANGGSDLNKAPQVAVKYKKHFTEKQQETIYFKIQPVNLADVIADDLTLAVSKKAQKKVPTVTWLGKKLVKGKDFDVSYPDENKAGAYQAKGEYTVLLTAGKSGNFTGSKTVRLTITDLIPVSKVAVKVKSQPYDKGNPVQPEPKVTYKGKALEKDVDYTVSYQNNTEIGTASVIVKGTGQYAGTKKVTFKITGTSIKKATVAGLASTEYTGAAQTLDNLTVTLGGSPLKEGEHYKVSFSKNRNAGKATVTISGIGQYTGTVKKTFKITAYDLKQDEGKNENRLLKGLEDDISVKLSEYTKGICKPEPVLTFKGRVLRKGRDYTISYKNNKKAAAATDQKAPTIVIKGKGNFKGTVQKAFTITE